MNFATKLYISLAVATAIFLGCLAGGFLIFIVFAAGSDATANDVKVGWFAIGWLFNAVVAGLTNIITYKIKARIEASNDTP